ncbi:MAG: hypothetical protein RL748_4554 [Pseudomonadota bacterium]
MATTTKPDQLLLRFRMSDTQNGVSRSTLAKLAKEVLPGYEMDDGELTQEQIAKIREAMPQDQSQAVKSSLF